MYLVVCISGTNPALLPALVVCLFLSFVSNVSTHPRHHCHGLDNVPQAV